MFSSTFIDNEIDQSTAVCLRKSNHTDLLVVSETGMSEPHTDKYSTQSKSIILNILFIENQHY